MANLTESATFDANVYRIDQTDPVLGWDGANLNIANQQAVALANRTQWLKERVDKGSRFTAITSAASSSPGSALNITTANFKGNLVRINTDLGFADVSLPLASATVDEGNCTISVEPGTSFNWTTGTSRHIRILRTGSDTITNLDTNITATTHIVQPLTIVRIEKVGASSWIMYRIASTAEAAPAGMVNAWAVNVPPHGWLECMGQAIDRTVYASLFKAIGTTFGAGNGSTTFNLPDLRGEFIRGWDDGRGIDSGRAFGSAQSDELKAHTHTYRGATIVPTGSDPTGTGSTFTTGNTGSTGGTETRPRNVALMFCIKY